MHHRLRHWQIPMTESVVLPPVSKEASCPNHIPVLNRDRPVSPCAFLNALFAVIPRRLPARSNDAEMICAAFLSLCRETRRTVDVAHLCSGGSGPVHETDHFSIVKRAAADLICAISARYTRERCPIRRAIGRSRRGTLVLLAG
jgi:hypothetical protein